MNSAIPAANKRTHLLPMTRLEIVVDEAHAARLIETLERHGLREYTAIHRATGRGTRGLREGDHFGAFSNAWLMIACPTDKAQAALPALRDELSQLGGLCLVTEVQMLDSWSA